MTSAREQIAESLADKEYRDLFVLEHIGQGLAFQIRAMRKDRDWSQTELGEAAGMRQTRVSQLEDPDYERLSLTTLKRLASAFDVGLMVRFVPFSQLVDWSVRLTHADLAVPSFADDAELGRETPEATAPITGWLVTTVLEYPEAPRLEDSTMYQIVKVGQTPAMPVQQSAVAGSMRLYG